MIECIRDDKGNITAVIEYLIFNNIGQLDDTGETVFIGEMEINPEHRGKKLIRSFIKTILNKYPDVKRCFFFRRYKYPSRNYRLYTRKQFELLVR